MTPPLTLDTTSLTHFARAGRLVELDQITDSYERLVVTEVLKEAQDGIAEYPAIGNLWGQSWFQIVELDMLETVRAAEFKAELGGPALKHLGECATLAAALTRDGTALIDDADGRRVGRRHGIDVAPSLSFVARAVKIGALDLQSASDLVSALEATDMRLPTDGPGFKNWALAHNLL